MILQGVDNMIATLLGLLCLLFLIVLLVGLYIELDIISKKCKKNIERAEKISDFAEEAELSPAELLRLYDIIRE